MILQKRSKAPAPISFTTHPSRITKRKQTGQLSVRRAGTMRVQAVFLLLFLYVGLGQALNTSVCQNLYSLYPQCSLQKCIVPICANSFCVDTNNLDDCKAELLATGGRCLGQAIHTSETMYWGCIACTCPSEAVMVYRLAQSSFQTNCPGYNFPYPESQFTVCMPKSTSL